MHIREIGFYLTTEQYAAYEATTSGTPARLLLLEGWWKQIEEDVTILLQSSAMKPPPGFEIEVRIWDPSGERDIDCGGVHLIA